MDPLRSGEASFLACELRHIYTWERLGVWVQSSSLPYETTKTLQWYQNSFATKSPRGYMSHKLFRASGSPSKDSVGPFFGGIEVLQDGTWELGIVLEVP